MPKSAHIQLQALRRNKRVFESKEKRGNWSAANISFPVSPILFFTIKTCLIIRVAVSFAHDYSFNSRLSDRSLFCFALGSLSPLQMVDIARSRCTKCLSSSHKSLKPRGERAHWYHWAAKRNPCSYLALNIHCHLG